MAGLIVIVAIMVIFSGVAFQLWTEMLRRDNEAEMIFRAQDLVRAIQRYRRDHGGIGPEKLEDLLQPGPKGQYYARQVWEDPLVPDGNWGLLYFGPGGSIVDPTVQQTGLSGLGLGGLGDDEDRGAGEDSSTRRRPSSRGPRGRLGPSQEGPTGLRIAGVKSLCEETPFRVYKDQTDYAQWLFTYLDLEQQGAAGAPGGEQNQQSPGGKAPFRKGRGQ
jgi:type II secretory pathway pseudopilin PulG